MVVTSFAQLGQGTIFYWQSFRIVTARLAQARLIEAIAREGWLQGGQNQVMCFGNMPGWALQVAESIPVLQWPEKVIQLSCLPSVNRLHVANTTFLT